MILSKAALGLVIESLVRSALESMVIFRRMDAEGRTHTTEEEATKIQEETDAAAVAARAEGQDL